MLEKLNILLSNQISVDPVWEFLDAGTTIPIKKIYGLHPGRYIGKAKDLNGRDCFVMVLSTREQHIRKEKATSNVCSNQAFLATLAGAALLGKGEKGMANSIREGT